MPLLQGTLTQVEREPVPAGDPTAPRRAYLIDHATVAGRYVLGTFSPDATAFLKASPIASALGRFVLDSAVAEEDRALLLVTPSRVIA